MKLLKVLPFLFLFFSQIVSAQLVWPGDVNNNGVVNEADLLALGFVFGETGPIRQNATTNWEGQAITQNWIGTFPNGLNKVYADCNGDGIINNLDADVIEQNFSLTHADVPFIPDEIPTGIPGISPSFSVLTEDLIIAPGQKIKEIEIGLGDFNIPVENITGLSFLIKVNPDVFDVDGTDFQLGGWLQGENIEIIKRKELPGGRQASGDFLVAYTVTDKVPRSGLDIIGNIILAPSITEADVPNFKISIDSILMVDANQEKIPVLGTEIIFELPDSLKADSIEMSQTICSGETVDFQGRILNTTGLYRDTLVNQFGRDSFIILDLQVADTTQAIEIFTICEGENFPFNGTMLTTSGIYRDTMQTVNGCDSFIVLFLNVMPDLQTQLDVTICPGESYLFNNQSLNSSGIYSATFTSQIGCDSLVTLNLVQANFKTTILEEAICEGEERVFNGETYRASGTYLDTFTTALNCDSFVQLNLTVLENYETFVDTLICAGESINYQGFILSETTTFWFSFEAANGCDSTVALNIQVEETDLLTTIDSTICAGETMLFNGFILVDSGIYTATFSSRNGCDSLIQVNLSVDSCATTSIEAIHLSEIQIFPNPVQENLMIHSSNLSIRAVQLVTVTGQVMYQQDFNSLSGQQASLQLDLQKVSPGMYWLNIYTEMGIRQELVVRL